jgi:hypothetical protein
MIKAFRESAAEEHNFPGNTHQRICQIEMGRPGGLPRRKTALPFFWHHIYSNPIRNAVIE